MWLISTTKNAVFVEDYSGKLKHRSEITNHFKHLKSIKKRLINKKELKLVGFTFDSKMTMEPMVKKTSKKGRAKIAALFRLRPYLSSNNLELMYKAFCEISNGIRQFRIHDSSTVQPAETRSNPSHCRETRRLQSRITGV